MASVDMCQHDWPGSGCKECFPPAAATPPLATVADHNAAFDPADEALGGAFRAGFREGWIHGQSPDGIDYGDLAERFPQAVDIEPS
jgi:hypothetical protein